MGLVRTGEVVLMAVWRAGSRGARPVPEKVRERCIAPRVRRMLALRSMDILAAMVLPSAHASSASLACWLPDAE